MIIDQWSVLFGCPCNCFEDDKKKKPSKKLERVVHGVRDI